MNKPTDILDRLRAPRITHHQVNNEWEPYATVAQTHPIPRLHEEAANEIERLRSEVESTRCSPAQQAEFDRDTDGELLMDWSPSKGRMVTLSLRADGRLSYAVSWDGESFHGTADMPVADSSATLAPRERKSAKLAVWFGSMPESNGKANWTAILHRGDISEGFTLARSEHKERVRYDADSMRFLIGELDKEPDILDYDGEVIEHADDAKFAEWQKATDALATSPPSGGVQPPQFPPSWRVAAQNMVAAYPPGDGHEQQWMGDAKKLLSVALEFDSPQAPVAWLRTTGTGTPVITEAFLRSFPEHRSDFEQPLYTRPMSDEGGA